jgi:hypothetical protein
MCGRFVQRQSLEAYLDELGENNHHWLGGMTRR